VRYGSVCSGIEAATVAWHSLGWEPAFFSEIEKFPREVLAYHYPDVPLHGDFTTIGENQYGSIDFLVGGTPCQSFSVAGLRKGLDDERGNLSLEFIKLAQRVRPRWVVWENVPGVLSSNGGRDFGSFLSALGEIGYGFAYRVLDAQYFGVAQRRRRVFVVGYLGDWRRAAAVLFERESLRGNPAPSREKGEKPAFTVTSGPPFSRTGNDRVECDANVTNWPAKVACTLNAAFAEKQGLEDQHINGGASLFVPQTIGPLTAGMSKGPRGTEGLESNHVLAFPSNANADSMAAIGNDLSPTLKHDPMAIQREMAVRRITPTECERLQGFPDGYTNIKDKCPDGPRYKALGNSMAVPVMKWIGERIQMVEDHG
jgi:DNA (cytosine-5)-methyltransferase 1